MKWLPEITRRITNSKRNKCPNTTKTIQNLASLKDFLTKYRKVKCVYTIDANRGDQNPLDITLRRWHPFPNVLIQNNVKVGTNEGTSSLRVLRVTSRMNIVLTARFYHKM